jgi:hypothetical protein
MAWCVPALKMKTATAAQPSSAQCHYQATGFTVALNEHENMKFVIVFSVFHVV